MNNTTSESPAPGPGQTPSPDLITKAEFARRVSLSVRSVEKLLAERRIPVIRLTHKMVRIPWTEAIEHLKRTYQINPK